MDAIKGIWKKGVIAAISAVVLNLLVFFIAFIILRFSRSSPGDQAAISKSLENSQVHWPAGHGILFLLGGFLLLFGVVLGINIVFRRRLSSSKEKNPDTKPETEILEYKSRAEKAEAESRRLEAILNSMFEGVIILDRDLRITYVNPRLCSLFGVDLRPEPVEKNWRGTSLLSYSRSTELEEAAQQVLLTGQPFELILKRYASGIEQNFEVLIAPLTAGTPETDQSMVVVVGDISRIVKLEQIRKNFAANVSHELRTPIQVVKGFAENILNSPPEDREQIHRFAEFIQKNAQTMENITNDLLSLVSLEDENSPRPPREETVLAPLIAEAVGMVEIAAEKKDISIDTFCLPDLKAMLYGSFIIQALVNLLDNAIKYSGPNSRIKVYAYTEGEQLVIEVKDKGIGIPAEHLGRIFERFYRVDRARQRTEHSREAKGEVKGEAKGEAYGTGLGLAIVRHIALLHNGTAEVESHAGEGSVFRLRLPSVHRPLQ